MRYQKPTPRADYRRQEKLRANASISLSEKFRELKSLTVELSYFSPEGVRRNNELKCTTNPDYAKSVFRFDCLNNACVGGDFDLSEALGAAVVAVQATATGEMCCQGWLSETTIDQIHCHHILRYKLILGYSTPAPTGIIELQPV
jgi:hypothetical protein